MPTLRQLQERRKELEEKLQAGDLSVEATLDQIDRAISSRTLKVQNSQTRMEVVKQAVAAGMDKDKARRINVKASVKKLAELRAKRLLNRF
jgi:ATP-dependent protease HslVU (ClpYQ) ATPase subunit